MNREEFKYKVSKHTKAGGRVWYSAIVSFEEPESKFFGLFKPERQWEHLREELSGRVSSSVHEPLFLYRMFDTLEECTNAITKLADQHYKEEVNEVGTEEIILEN